MVIMIDLKVEFAYMKNLMKIYKSVEQFFGNNNHVSSKKIERILEI